jgi:hypothetical protein
MFGFQGGEHADVVARKRGYMKEAQEKWRFLTNFDCSTITTAGQLSALVKVRSSISEQRANQDVRDWMQGREFGSTSTAL